MAGAKVQIVAIRKSTPSTSSSESPPENVDSGLDAPLAKEKKKRTSKPKVRSGCVTCKIRRIKCDETKPECTRCTSTGRKCDGYIIKPRKKRSDAHSLTKAPEINLDIGPPELRALGFFHHKTAPSLSSYFDAEFWTRLVFQMSYVEPSVRHAMISLGALHEERERGIKLIPIMPGVVNPLYTPKSIAITSSQPGDDFALAQYNKAIVLLSRRMDSGSAIEVALLACILFVCIEFLRGDSEPAVKHFRSGMSIALNSLSNKNSAAAKDTLERIREHMLPFFNRIELLANLFGENASWDYPVELNDSVPEEFRDMRDARDSIVHIANLTVRFIKFMKWRKYTRLVLPDHVARQAALLRQMDVWQAALDKRVDIIKSAVLEAMREQGSSARAQQSQDTQELHSVLADMKMSFARAASAGLELDDIRSVVEDVVGKQSQALVLANDIPDDRSMNHRREVSELEGRLNETLAGALEEANRRRAVEERETDTKRMLRLAEEELQLLRSSASDDRSRLRAAEDERESLLRRAERAEDAQRDLEDRAKDLEAEHEAAQATLEEYRMSSKKWRQDIDQATADREDLENTISSLERELEESQVMGAGMRRRLEKLHADMASAAGQLISEKAAHQAREEEYRVKSEELQARQQRDLDDRSRLEAELRALRAGTAEVIETRLTLDHLKSSNVALDETVRQLRLDLAEQQSLATRFERDFHDAKDIAQAEVERTKVALSMDIESANHQVNVVRNELEGEVARVRAELESSKIESETVAARHVRVLEEEEEAKREALRKVNHASSVALDETRQRHEITVQDLQAAHKRALDHALEDKQRSEYFLNERLSLSDAKLQHLQDRVLHLEERLEVAKSAAQAAALKAQSKAVPMVSSSSSGLPEKISPQALRESILVLQEQLQERESTIDKLKARVDHKSPAELKKRDDEISWLRELLSVRSEDLADLVNTLAQPTFDRAAVRNSAIRIRASLQMEQQEKERLSQGQSTLPSQAIASLSNFATPKAAQLGAAFNKWRNTMESSSLRNAPQGPRRAGTNTPSKAPSAPPKMPPGYSAGLMTPPASNLRSTPSPEATLSLPPPQLRPDGADKENVTTPKPSFTSHSREPSEVSQTSEPPLLRSQSYDKDAEDNKVPMESLEDETLDVADSEPPAFRSLEAELEDIGDDESVA